MIGPRRCLRASVPLLVSLAVALPALGLTGCRSHDAVGRGPAAVVNGHEISRAQVERLVSAQKAEVTKQRGSTSPAVLEFVGTGTDTLGANIFSFALSQLVRDQIIADALQGEGVSIKDDLAQARSQLESKYPGGKAALDKIDKVLVDAKVRSDALSAALGTLVAKQRDPADQAKKVRALYPQYAAASPDCISAILAVDEQGANAAKQSLDAGVDFAQVAATLSTDQQTAQQGGFLACTTADEILTQLNVDVSKRSAGDVIGPIEVPGQGYALFRLDSTTGPTFEEARPQIEKELDAQGSGAAAVAGRQTKLEAAATVQVDPRYGTWNPKDGTVDPPVGPMSTTIPAPQLPGS